MIRDMGNMRTIAFLALGVFIALSTATIAGAVVLHVVWYHQEEAAKADHLAEQEDWTNNHCDNCAPSEATRACRRAQEEAYAEFGIHSPLYGRPC
jgi:hypothetical protein